MGSKLCEMLDRKCVVCLATVALLGLFIGCQAAPPSDDDDLGELDDFAIVTGRGFNEATRVGTFTATTTEGVFTCRSTSTSAEPLAANAFFAPAPNHRLTLTTALTGLTVEVVSDDEIVLWIRSGANNFCNDAGESFIERGSWSAGDYDIFMGSPTEGTVIEYTLRVSR